MDRLFKKLEAKYNSNNFETNNSEDECSFLHQKLLAFSEEKNPRFKNFQALKTSFQSWKAANLPHSTERLKVFETFLELDNELMSPFQSPLPSPTSSPTPDHSVFGRSIFKPIPFEKNADDDDHHQQSKPP